MSVSATMSSASSVYHGPSSTNYASVGSVGLNEAVQVIAIEKNWFYIEYTTSTNNKRGYVPYSTINNAATVASSVPTRNFTGYGDVPAQSVTVYMGPGLTFATSGSVSVGEGITKFNEISGSYTYIEFSTASKTKRGYVLSSQLANRNRGVLANVNASSVSVYSGPGTIYFQSGGVYQDEYVVILEQSSSSSPAWYYIEFNSTSGRKRGYVDQTPIVPYSSLTGVVDLKRIQGASTAQQNLTVYSGPNPYFATVGSISLNEMVNTIEGVSVESYYAFIEYNTTSGKKRGYVVASSLQALPGSFATMLSTSDVYHGPDSINYATVGSVGLDEGVQVLAMENNWFYIEYFTSTNNKRGYVPYETINNADTIANTVPARIFTGFADVPNADVTVYMGPNTSYSTSGSISLNEGITKFNEASGDYTYIEYSTSSGTKRGYILTSQLSNRNRGVLATVSATSASVYSGPDSVYYHSGGVFQGEYVVILERDISSVYLDQWYCIEFNSTSGRKRGYVEQDLISPRSSLDGIETLRTSNGLALALQDLTVYSGPNSNFASAGSIFANERVSVFDGVSAESEYSYIEYNTVGSASKRGYVPASALQPTSITLPVISVPNVTEGVYGYSGNNRALKYYKFGNGGNVLAAVFSVHGYEDAWAADGEELYKIAKRLIQELAADNLPSWTVYVIPLANPDGLLDGWTNNGPGRTTVSTVNDINRSFPANFNAVYDSRNYTGSTSLASPEALALSQKLLEWKPSVGTMILLDVHGWLNQSIGDYEVGQHFCNEFGFSNSSLDSASGFLTRWGQLNGMLASLIELPFPNSPQDITSQDFAGKFIQATRNLLYATSSSIPVSGIIISPTSVALNNGETQQFSATMSPTNATNQEVTWMSSNSNVATVDPNGLVTAGINNGNAIITVQTIDGSFTDSALVGVTVTGSSFSYANNAQVRGDFLYVRDANGNILNGQVNDGDIITVLEVDYANQLAYIEYPTQTGVSSGYVNNNNLIKYYHLNEWKNGSTTEIVYDETSNPIGSIFPFETATILFQRSDGMYAVVYSTDKGANTKSGFVYYSGYTDSDKPAQSSFSFPNNAQVVGDFLYVRDANGNIKLGEIVNDGDYVTIIDVNYTTQLALVEYPSDSSVLVGYVTNATNIIQYLNPGEWKNGSTLELVFDENGNQIGSLSPYETATPLYRTNGMTKVIYNTSKGVNTKSGFVKYSGDSVYNDPGKITPPAPTGTPGNMIASDVLVNFVASYEGFSASPYRGVDYQNLTIGYGHVIQPGENFTTLTETEALAILKSDLSGYEESVNSEFGSILNQYQFDSLVSFCYNTGKNVWKLANLTNDVKTGASDDQLKTDFTNWSHCNGQIVQGLLNRRLDEWEMFVNGDYVRTH